MERYSRIILMVVVVLALMAGAAIALDMWAWQGRKAAEATIFQKATGGLGMGAIATPIWQFINYDARIFSVDDSITWPVPGGYSYGPDRTATVSYFEEAPENQWIFHRP
jgi:hypothetical protein